jgi:transposase-like protein
MKGKPKKSERARFQKLLAEGLSVTSAARQVGVHTSTGYAWTRGRAHRVTAPQFAELVPESSAARGIELEIDGAVVRINGDFDERVLVRLITALRSAAR